MSRQDRFFATISSVQSQIGSYVDSARSNGATASAQQQGHGVAATLPAYQSHSTGPPVPQRILNAPPGQAQVQADSMGAIGSGALLKRVHTYSTPNGKVTLNLYTPPQKTPTYMGGTVERRRGALTGSCTIDAGERERISTIRIKMKVVATVVVPANARPGERGPVSLEGRSRSREAVREDETLLMQLEQSLYTATPANPEGEFPHGHHSYDFRFELLARTPQGHPLPPSFVLECPKSSANASVQGGGLTATINSAIGSAKSHLPASLSGDGDWASLKYYLKLTIVRPGLLRANERVFAPFQYLPPPEPKMLPLLDRRFGLASQIRNNLADVVLVEPVNKWKEIALHFDGRPSRINGRERGSGSTGGVLSSILGRSKSEKSQAAVGERWTLLLPDPPIFPLRTGIPYLLRLDRNSSGPAPAPPLVQLCQQVHLKGKLLSAVSVKDLAGSRLFAPTAQPKDRATIWRGILELPPQCGPCFETVPDVLTLEYFLSIRRHSTAPIAHGEPCVLVCPLPANARGRDLAPAITPPPPTTAASQGTSQGSTVPPSQQVGTHAPHASSAASTSAPQYPQEKASATLTSIDGASTSTFVGGVPPPIPARPSLSTASSAASIPITPVLAAPLAPPTASQTQASVTDPRADQDDLADLPMDLPPSYFEATHVDDRGD